MPDRQTAADFPPEVLRLFDRYVHGQIDRRGFLEQATRVAAGSAAAAAGWLAALSPDFAFARVAADDTRVKTARVDFASPAGHGTVRAYVAQPARAPAALLPVVMVIHENRGLNPHIEDVTRRFALEGYVAIAPDALHPLGGYPGDEDKARSLFTQLDQGKTQQDFLAAAERALAWPGGNGRLGAVGFCYGGGMVNFLAARVPALRAAAPFYGRPAPEGEAAKIRAEMLHVFAEHDERINASWPAYEAALKAAGVRYQAHVYPGTQHGFHNDTTPRFDEKAAALAWERTLALFRRHLAG